MTAVELVPPPWYFETEAGKNERQARARARFDARRAADRELRESKKREEAEIARVTAKLKKAQAATAAARSALRDAETAENGVWREKIALQARFSREQSKATAVLIETSDDRIERFIFELGREIEQVRANYQLMPLDLVHARVALLTDLIVAARALALRVDCDAGAELEVLDARRVAGDPSVLVDPSHNGARKS